MRQDDATLNEIEKLEGNFQQLQLNLASAHQRHKSEVCRFEHQVATLERQLNQTTAQLQHAEHDIGSKEGR
ncbi:hypothetical protein Btru_065905 [Bulinus truncatus]|nr:hypothetical protein Btru_065905 [Bulinus truncatus]